MNLHYTGQFKRDYKKAQKQNRDIIKLREVVEMLLQGEAPPPKYRDHQLTGKWNGHRDCHIEPDWILIYRYVGDDLFLERTGSHSELFKK